MFSSMLSLLGSLRGGSSFITNSLRFRSSASAFLSRTFTTPTSNTTWTWSGWVKRGALGVWNSIFSSGVAGNGFAFNPTNNLIFALGNVEVAISTAVFRDPSAYYHLVVRSNGTNIKGFVNNLEVLSYTGTIPAVNSAATHYIFCNGGINNFVDGYLTEVNFIDGQALTPASFGAIDSSTGVWAPRPYSGTYGTNGFYLKFANTSSVAALGNDSSGNNNTWTVNNVSLTAGATYDSMIDVPVNYSDGGNGRGNYCTLSPIDKYNLDGAISNGNLTITGSQWFNSRATFGVSSGKWYWETAHTVFNQSYQGIANGATIYTNNALGTFTTGYNASYNEAGVKWVNGVNSAYGATLAIGDVVGFALDMDAGTLTCYKNNTSQGVMVSGLTGVIHPACSAANGAVINANFGQRPFQNTTAWTTLQAAGFRALNTNNLPTPSIVNGANFMAATTYTGNAAARSLSNAVNSVSFQPDLVWIKSRTPGATNHALFDSTRGATAYLSSNTTTTETTLAQSLTAFGADGFSLGTDTTLVNANANSYVAWQWKKSVAAGLDVVTYTGTGAVQNINHSLGIAPAMVIVKNRTGSLRQWTVYHKSIPNSQNGGIYLNLTNSWNSDVTLFNNTAPTSSQFTVGTYYSALGETLVAYCFAEIAGFSRFGSYTGNGLADGPFVSCGFRPRFVMIKRTDTSGFDWFVYDSVRDTFNVSQNNLRPNTAGIESAQAANYIDLTSNGFKLRGDNTGSINNTSGTYIFAAFAENPSKYALAR